MIPDARACYAALRARDARFDGRIFVAVSSTGIYCRPVCTVRPPRFENCAFYPSAAAAEASGYRPCLRCRPELAPGFARIDSSAVLARRAAMMIEDRLSDGVDCARLAGVLGVTDRHLRRVFGAEFGVSPVQYMQSQRMLLAKRLLTDTDLPVTEIAFASGFSSIRRFNASFLERYRFAPSRLRGNPAAGAGVRPVLKVEIAYRPPYDWDGILEFLGRRTIAGVESVTHGLYRRTVRPFGGAESAGGWIEVAPTPRRNTLSVSISASLSRRVAAVIGRVRQLFDTDCRPDEIAATLGDVARANHGVRLPGAFDPFEMAVRAILGQQVSVRAAHTLAARVAQRFGSAIGTPFDDLRLGFPAPSRLAACEVGDIASLGIIAQRANSLRSLARALDSRAISLDPGADVESTIRSLKQLPGIGEWTAEYLAMRALHWPDAFPASDLGVRKALGVDTASQARELAHEWRPWRGYAVMHLWRSLAKPVVSSAAARGA